MEALRIITVNTWKCEGEYAARIRWLTEEAQALHPEILACQEVFRDESGELDTLEALQKGLNMDAAWAPARYKERASEGRSVQGWSGMALLSTRRWTYVDVLDLPSDPRDGERVAQVGLLELERVAVVVANVHLTHLPDAAELRREQIECVLKHPLMQMKLAMRVVCGDFNSRPDDELMTGLAAGHEFGNLRDAFLIGGGRGDRATLTPRGVEAPGRCVDYILSQATNADTHPLFTSSTITFNRPHPETGILPSDHFGVAATMLPTRIHGWLRMDQSVG